MFCFTLSKISCFSARFNTPRAVKFIQSLPDCSAFLSTYAYPNANLADHSNLSIFVSAEDKSNFLGFQLQLR